LVLVDGNDVIASSVGPLFTTIAVRDQGVARDDLALDREHSQQFQCRLVFVGLGIHPELTHDGSDVRGRGRDQVNRGSFTVATATGGRAVDREVGGVIRPQPSTDPPTNARLEVRDVDPSKDPRRGGLAEAAPPREAEELQELSSPLLAVIHDGLVAGHAREHGDDSQREQRWEGMPLALRWARIVNTFKEFHQRDVGFHA
jgi:hypothetical protein